MTAKRSGPDSGSNVLCVAASRAVDSGGWQLTTFGNGRVGWLWEPHPKMPRIDDFWRGCVVHLHRSVEDARNPEPDDFGCPKGASGCLFVKHTKRQSHFYVVTNRHVVRGGGVVPKLFPAGGQARIIDCVEDSWLCDEVEDDLAILPLDESLAVHALVEAHFPSEEDEARLDLGVGDDVFMWGRFWGQVDGPVARFGNIAAWPARQVQCRERTQESILVEMRSHSGYSGSPVFLYINPGSARPWIHSVDPEIGPQHYVKTERFELFFIGIDWAHIGGTAMAAVVPWYKVGDLLNCSKLVHLRTERDRKAGPTATPD